MSVVLELSVTVLVSQSVLILASPLNNHRDKQLLRRELGAELSSIIDTWRRYSGSRGGRSPGPVRSAKSPGPSRSPAPPSYTSTPAPSKQPGAGVSIRSPGPPPSSPGSRCSNRDSSDNYMKIIAAVVNNVFK